MKHRLLIAGAGCLAVALLAFGLGASVNGAERSKSITDQPVATSDSRHTGSSPTPASATDTLEAGNLLGMEIASLEAKVGPAKNVSEDQRVYGLGPCDITVTAENGQVRGVKVPVSQSCSSAQQSLLASQGLPTTKPLTFGAYAAAVDGAKFGSDCLYSRLCGNAFDPRVFMTGRGSHAGAGVMTRVTALQVDAPVLAAADLIEKAVSSGSGEDYLMSNRFNCDSTYDAVALSALRDVPVETIEVGYDLQAEECS